LLQNFPGKSAIHALSLNSDTYLKGLSHRWLANNGTGPGIIKYNIGKLSIINEKPLKIYKPSAFCILV
jgi:hypothetical protein